ncbi:ribonuclease P protein subunit p14-like [Mercenaria mercenaria]|uniref:ribonuclease P protein subunit p14-like n=1 Tax=Mercenaria mercenaria TaxID=6596 RepID=UPI00234F915E|nr:ribonuclease P protein subunit p14-like [Mercenaria mercenaria]
MTTQRKVGEKSDLVMYKKLVTKGTTDYCYLNVRLDFEDAGPEISAIDFKQIILEAVTSLFGLAGASTLIDILRYDQADRTAVVRIYHRFLTKLWSSLSFYGNYRGRACAFRVLQVSAHLMAMACNSRSMVIEVEQEK